MGMIGRLSRNVEVGASWKSRTVITSTGRASGDASAQFAVLGVSTPATFAYKAGVRNVLPESVTASVAWQASHRWLLSVQGDWINWASAFVSLPVTLTQGTNATINGIVGSTSLLDAVPLHWKDQYALHAGAERGLTENTVIRFGYAHANDPVPSSTLTPLTAAIMSNQVSGGFTYARGHSHWDLAYSFHPANEQHVQQSALLYGEYGDSDVRVGTQSIALAYSYHF